MLLGDGAGRFRSYASVRGAGGLNALADFDSDGDLDVAYSSWSLKRVVTHLNAGNGTFVRGTTISSQAAGQVGIGDFTRRVAAGRGQPVRCCEGAGPKPSRRSTAQRRATRTDWGETGQRCVDCSAGTLNQRFPIPTPRYS